MVAADSHRVDRRRVIKPPCHEYKYICVTNASASPMHLRHQCICPRFTFGGGDQCLRLEVRIGSSTCVRRDRPERMSRSCPHAGPKVHGWHFLSVL